MTQGNVDDTDEQTETQMDKWKTNGYSFDLEWSPERLRS